MVDKGSEERVEKLSPSHSEDAVCGNQNGPGRSGSEESSDLSSRGIRGVTAIRCAWCKARYVPNQPEGTYHKDSDGMCDTCLANALAEVKPPADAERDWGYTCAFLTGLGLWSLPGGVL